ncbi:MAG: histidine triad (HIT) family protein [Patescibacteria group bacterium]|jgi:histidine triad (HIT) family protein
MQDKSCIFCKIINKDIPANILHEDKTTFAFLDNSPIAPGHLLVIPKNHHADIFTTPDKIVADINITCKKMAKLCKEKLQCTGVNILNASGLDAQQSVFHLHYHVIPRHKDDELNLNFHGDGEKNITKEEVYKKLRN